MDKVGLESLALGDLNGDGVDDGAVVLWWAAGGSGAFKYLAAVVSEDGTPRQAAIEFLGDRVQINSLTIDNNQIVVDIIAHGPDDPMCCPTQQVINTYALQGDQLVLTSSEVVSDAGPALDITNIVWQWEETVTPVDTTTVDDPSKYTRSCCPAASSASQLTVTPETAPTPSMAAVSAWNWAP